MWIGYRKEIRKLTFPALAFRRSESRSCGLCVVYIGRDGATLFGRRRHVNQRPYYPWEIWENAAIFLRLVLPSTLIITETKLCENALQTRRTWKRRLFVFVWMETCWKRSIRKRWRQDDHVMFLARARVARAREKTRFPPSMPQCLADVKAQLRYTSLPICCFTIGLMCSLHYNDTFYIVRLYQSPFVLKSGWSNTALTWRLRLLLAGHIVVEISRFLKNSRSERWKGEFRE